MGRAWRYFRQGPARNWLIRAIHDDALAEVVPMLSGRLLDIGCANKPYAAMVRPYITEHVGVDHASTQHTDAQPDIVADAYDIPQPDASFDSVLCTAVLEHLEEPQRAISECYRLLRPGGVAIYSVPLIWHEHEAPRDFFRYTQFGLKHLFGTAGFVEVRCQPLSGFWVTFCQLLSYKLFKWKKRPLLGALPVIDVVCHAIQLFGRVMDRVDFSPEWTWMYLVTARKAQPTHAEPGR